MAIDPPELPEVPRPPVEERPVRPRAPAPQAPPVRPERVPAPARRRPGELEVTWEAPEAEPRPSFLARHERALLVAFVVIGVLLRAVPILWGSTWFHERQATFHPDEPKLVRPLDDFPASLRTFDDYRYPTLLPFAYGALWVPVRELAGLADDAPSKPGAPSYEAAQVFGRALNVLLFGLGGLWLLWAFTRRLFGPEPALLAVAAANVMGRPLVSTAMVLPDVPSAVLLCAAFYALLRAEERPRPTWRAMVPVGVALGAAAATKYTAGVGALGVAFFAAYLWKRRRVDGRTALRLLLTAAGAALVTFLVCVPGALYDTQRFLHGLSFEYRSKLVESRAQPSTWLPALEKNFPLWLLALAAVGAVLAPRRQRAHLGRPSVVLGAAALSLTLYLALVARSFRADYGVLFFPFVAVLAGLGLWELARVPSRRVGAAVAALALTLGTVQAGAWSLQRYTDDVRYRADAWIRAHVPPGPLGLAPSPLIKSAGIQAPVGYRFVGVKSFPDYVVLFEQRTTHVLDFFADPAEVRARMLTYLGETRVAQEFSTTPGERRLGQLRELDLCFYEDVLFGERRAWKYDLVAEIDPVDSPLDLTGGWIRIYRRTGR
ncbi:MAG: glycosyltransferase family 39 protein [Planctomycetes bacterium]|nr:glycosyltransferase family 39 protein [Planctomycetota bacterium]